MLKKVALTTVVAVVAIIAVLLVVIAMQPNEYSVSRSATVNAPAERVFANVNDFHKWDAWSPWAKIDPNMKQSFDGPPAGKGAAYTWEGNDQVGKGRMEIAESKPAEHIKIDLKFLEPWEADNVTDFTFKPAGEKTEVNWSMSGRHNFVSKAMCLVMDMDKMIGPDFEKGLSQLKTVAEAAPVQ